MFNNILIVCVGNICRSPTAECLFKKHLAGQGYNIQSAGLKALEGKNIDPMAQRILAENSVNCDHHSARQLTTEYLHNADIVLVMEKAHIEPVLALVPEARGKVFLLGKWQHDREIPDPHKQSQAMFEHTYTLIDEAVNAWIKRLN